MEHVALPLTITWSAPFHLRWTELPLTSSQWRLDLLASGETIDAQGEIRTDTWQLWPCYELTGEESAPTSGRRSPSRALMPEALDRANPHGRTAAVGCCWMQRTGNWTTPPASPWRWSAASATRSTPASASSWPSSPPPAPDAADGGLV
jgi:hypothetical protein